MIPEGRTMSYFYEEETCSFVVKTRVHLGYEITIPQNMGPCYNDYKELCNDTCLCVLNSSIDRFIRLTLLQLSLEASHLKLTKC